MRDLLRLHPGDNQGVRYLLATRLLQMGDDIALETLLAQYPDDWSANWKYSGVITASFDLVRLAHNPSFEIPISISATTSVRFWVGLTSAAFAHAAVPTTSCIAFRFDSGFDSGQWKGVVSDGTNYSITSGLGAAVTGANRNLLQMRTDGSTVYFRFNGGAEASLSTNLPLTTTDLGLEICLQHNGNNS